MSGLRLRAAWRFATRHKAEMALLVFGALLRLSMALTFDARRGFDFASHWAYIRYLVDHHALPALDYNTTTYHPPLYYTLAALLVSAGLNVGAIGWLAVLLGTARLVIVWMALERWLPESRLARVLALWAAAIIPAGLQLDGMVTNETLSVFLSALVLLFAPRAIAAAREGRTGPSVALAVCLGLALITKFSAGVLVLAATVAVAVDIRRDERGWRAAWRVRARPALTAATIVVGISGWFFVRNLALYGMAAPTGYEGWAKANKAPFAATPYLDRRTLGFFVDWDPTIYKNPFYPSGYVPHPRFFPVLVATTFSDYYAHGFIPGVPVRARRIAGSAMALSRLSVVGGTLMALVVAATWIVCLRRVWRREEGPRLVLLLVPMLGVLGQIHFATKYPSDAFGPIKGAYLQFVAPAFCALFGLGTAFLWRRRPTRLLAIVSIAGVSLVTVYVGYCRVPRKLSFAESHAPLTTVIPRSSPPRATGT